MTPLPWIFDDGGRAAAGFRGQTSDCVCRAIAIATEVSYREIYDALNTESTRERPRGRSQRSSARTGVHKRTFRRYLEEHGWVFTPTMGIGTGCRVHLAVGELPKGRLIVSVSRHSVAVIDGVIHDTHDPTRNGRRCVYGYFSRKEQE
jgi:hypothetical protein